MGTIEGFIEGIERHERDDSTFILLQYAVLLNNNTVLHKKYWYDKTKSTGNEKNVPQCRIRFLEDLLRLEKAKQDSSMVRFTYELTNNKSRLIEHIEYLANDGSVITMPHDKHDDKHDVAIGTL